MTKSITIFDVVLVPFPFTDLKSAKKRPCLILAKFKPRGLPEHYVIAMITSHVSGTPFPGDWVIEKIEEAGLPKASLIRTSKVVTIDASLIQQKLGNLSEKDRIGVKREFKELFHAPIQ